MANAICRIESLSPELSGTSILVGIVYSGSQLEMPDGPQQAQVLVIIEGHASANAVKTAMSTAVTQRALDFGLTCIGTNMLLPTFQKG